MRRGLALAGLLAAGCALLACDSIFGIQTYPDPAPDAGADATTEAGPTDEGGADAAGDTSAIDSSVESSPGDSGADSSSPADAPGDSAEQADAAADVADEMVYHCTPMCDPGDTRCVGTQLQSCAPDSHNCYYWNTPTTCGGGGTCWGVAFTAYCWAGGPSVCAPSCHTPGAGDPDAGNGQTNCGRAANDSCCTTLDVTGGTFLRSYDGVTATDATNPASVSSFGLDKYEVTVGRFRQFVTAVSAGLGWVPLDGSGIHTHLNGGNGVVDSSDPDGGTYEQGWQDGFNSYLPATTDWTAYLQSDPVHSTWTNNPGPYEAYAINSVNWYVAYAFCIGMAASCRPRPSGTTPHPAARISVCMRGPRREAT